VSKEFIVKHRTQLFTSAKPYTEHIPYPERLGSRSSAQAANCAISSTVNSGTESLAKKMNFTDFASF